MKALFIDASLTELKKNYLSIAKMFATKDESFESVFIDVDTASYVVPKLEELALTELAQFKNLTVKRFKSFNRNKIRAFLDDYRPDFLFIDAMNVSNEVWIALCHEKGIKVYLYPHGFEVENLYYKSSQIIGKVSKVLRYCYAVWNIARVLHLPYLKTLSQYINFIRKGTPLCGTLLDNPQLYPNTVFVYSDYYKGFWERKYGVKDVNYVQIMPYDFMMVDDILKKPVEKACCYITQTLCEDGRFTTEEFEKLIENYRKVAETVDKFIIKLHPRVDSALYDKIFGDMPNVEIRRDFPHCSVYLTHYSSMVYTGVLASGNVIIHELPGQPTADVFKDVASKVVSSIDEIVPAYNELNEVDASSFEERCQRIGKYANYTGISPHEILSKTILGK